MMAVFSLLVLTSQRTINIFITMGASRFSKRERKWERVRLVHVHHKFCGLFLFFFFFLFDAEQLVQLQCHASKYSWTKAKVTNETENWEGEREVEQTGCERQTYTKMCEHVQCSRFLVWYSLQRWWARTIYICVCIACRNHIKNFLPEKNFYNQLPTIFQFSCKFWDDIVCIYVCVCMFSAGTPKIVRLSTVSSMAQPLSEFSKAQRERYSHFWLIFPLKRLVTYPFRSILEHFVAIFGNSVNIIVESIHFGLAWFGLVPCVWHIQIEKYKKFWFVR